MRNISFDHLCAISEGLSSYHPFSEEVNRIEGEMFANERIRSIINEMDREYRQQPGKLEGHSDYHPVGVAKIASLILQRDYPRLPFKEEIELAGILHDKGDRKSGMLNHQINSARGGVLTLERYGYNKDQIARVVLGILSHPLTETGMVSEFRVKEIMRKYLSLPIPASNQVQYIGRIIFDSDGLEKLGRAPYLLGFPDFVAFCLSMGIRERTQFDGMFNQRLERITTRSKNILTHTGRLLFGEWTKYLNELDMTNLRESLYGAIYDAPTIPTKSASVKAQDVKHPPKKQEFVRSGFQAQEYYFRGSGMGLIPREIIDSKGFSTRGDLIDFLLRMNKKNQSPHKK